MQWSNFLSFSSLSDFSVNFMAAAANTESGDLQLLVTTQQRIPIENAVIEVFFTGDPDNSIERGTTDASGKVSLLHLPAPPVEYSYSPTAPQPYSEYTLRITAPGFTPVTIAGIEILGNQISYESVILYPDTVTSPSERIVIPQHTLYGDYPPKIAESEIKPLDFSGEIVLNQVVIPEYIIVHDGPPRDSSAPNYYVRYKDYIKNVASSEIYATWPYETLVANILAIQSFTLNRVYTEWYRSKGYSFTITSSTAYDQKWINGRNTFESIDTVVDDIFDLYLSRPNVRQPILTQYCDGRRISCPQWLSQWGSKDLGEQGYDALEILRYYYGDSIYINTAKQVSGVPSSYPGFPLSSGDSGEDVMKIQNQLNAISNNYPLIPKLIPDGIFGPKTEASVQTFQSVFGLTPDGIVGPRTWYRIQDIYVAVTRLAENI